MIDARADASDRSAQLRFAFDHAFAAARSATTDDVASLLDIRVGGDAYAIHLSEIAGLLADRKVVHLPSPVPELLGIAGVRGGIIPIYSLRALLGYPSIDENPRWLLLVDSKQPVGLVFEHFTGYLRVPRSALSFPAQAAPRPTHVQENVLVADSQHAVLSIRSILATIAGRDRP